ncbi:adenosylcobinamide-GDP ribazoletransferase [Alloyangia pacifica]|uniref:Adenosylcobinamide-GDP ribazoletransferase n=1 Tax=Alloyangia pacifica TaxID=311180 RepID=A0A1I6VSG2_9RHOB|nr:adenosylcobinamide-GDP ribazoletransferase [Alloyangia pacifica]SDI12790.1 cobalamin-5'-phosphate synthase [Alloyangia pacifica]SFT16655.1 cobalamin-5'-phosphate synthase [Alloyangia pacifica]
MTGPRGRLRELQVAVMLLTRLPAGRIPGQAPSLSAARWAFPLVGALVGLIGWAAYAGMMAAGAGPLLAAVAAVAAQVLVTGALHVDGLADFADGMGGGRDQAHCLEIMRDSRIGSYGVMALLLAAAFWIAALAQLGPQLVSLGGAGWFVLVGMFSRAAMVGLQELLPPARADGMGRLAAGRSTAARVMLLCLGLLGAVLAGTTGLLLALLCATVATALGRMARRRLGGVTGDVLGAVQLVSEAASWVALALMLAPWGG